MNAPRLTPLRTPAQRHLDKRLHRVEEVDDDPQTRTDPGYCCGAFIGACIACGVFAAVLAAFNNLPSGG